METPPVGPSQETLPRAEHATWTSASEVPEEDVEWLWSPYIPAEKLTIIAGMGGEGKGLVAMHLAACVTTGARWPESEVLAPIGDVIWCEAEDGAGDTLIPRMKAASADPTKIFIRTREEFAGDLSTNRLRDFILKHGVRLLVLSPMNSFLGRVSINDEAEVRRALEKLVAAVQGTGCAIIGIGHASKKADLSAIERVLGSVAFVNFCRSVLLVGPDPQGDDRRRMTHAKFNLSSRGADLLYVPEHIGPGAQRVRIKWYRPARDIDPAFIFSRRSNTAQKVTPTADEWLTDLLTKKGKMFVSEVEKAAAAANQNWEAVRKAHQRNEKFRTEHKGFQGRHSWWIADGV